MELSSFSKKEVYIYLHGVKATYAYMFESVLFQTLWYLILSKPIGQAMFDQRQILKVKFWLQLLVVLLGLTNPKAISSCVLKLGIKIV